MTTDYQLGFQAFIDGEPLSACPHRTGPQRRGWVTGWLAASKWHWSGRGVARMKQEWGNDCSRWPVDAEMSLRDAFNNPPAENEDASPS